MQTCFNILPHAEDQRHQRYQQLMPDVSDQILPRCVSHSTALQTKRPQHQHFFVLHKAIWADSHRTGVTIAGLLRNDVISNLYKCAAH